MMLTIGGMTYHLADSEDPSRIVDEVLDAARAGAGLLHFETIDHAQLTAVVTSHTPVVVAQPGVTGYAVAEASGEDCHSYVDDLWL
jgi:hypothetical protein